MHVKLPSRGASWDSDMREGIGEPDDIAYGVVYLASDESKFVTGAELVIGRSYATQ